MLNTTSNIFIFNLSKDFVPSYMEDKYKILLDSMNSNYSTVLDYINANLQSIEMPALTFSTVEQVVAYGKKNTYKGSGAPNDVFNRELNITFKLTDSFISYKLLSEACMNFYMSSDRFIKELTCTLLDINRRELYKVYFKNIVFKSLSPVTFASNDINVDEKTVTLSFVYNEIDEEFIPYYQDTHVTGKLIDDYSQQIDKNSL